MRPEQSPDMKTGHSLWRAACLAAMLTAASAGSAPAPDSSRGPWREGDAVRKASTAVETGYPASFLRALLAFYRAFISPFVVTRCSMEPSCSAYSGQVIAAHGAAIGIVMTVDRLTHEADEADYVPLIRSRAGDMRYLDPVENNDFWWRSQ